MLKAKNSWALDPEHPIQLVLAGSSELALGTCQLCQRKLSITSNRLPEHRQPQKVLEKESL